MKIHNFTIRRPTMTRSAWWKLFRDWLLMSLLGLVMAYLAPVPTPALYFAVQLTVLFLCVAGVVWLTLIVRVVRDEMDGPQAPTQFTSWWLQHMAHRIHIVREHFRSRGVRSGKSAGV